MLYRNFKQRQLPSNQEVKKKLPLFFDDNVNKNTLSHNQKILNSIYSFVIIKSNEPVHSEEIAKAIGISLRTLQRITREELDLTPTNYIYVIKLKLAADYLMNKKGNVTEAAYEFGFPDSSYFSKIFKKYYGVSPTDYVKDVKNIQNHH